MILGPWFRQVINGGGDAQEAVRPQQDEQAYFLQRLERLASLQRNEGTWGRLNDVGQELLRWAIYSTYCDCVDLAAEGAARRILHPEQIAAGIAPSAEDGGR